MSNLVKFGSYSAEAAEQESKQLGKTEFLKLEVGRNRVRVLPPAVGKNSPFRIVQQHMVEVPGQQYPMRFQCPGKGCPACIRSGELSRTGNPKDRDAAYQLSAKPRVFAVVINRKEPERGPLVWEFGKKIHEQLKALRVNEDAGGDFTDPYKGFDIIIEREGTGKNDTRYLVMAARQSSQLAADEETMQGWIDGSPDVERFAKPMTLDEVRKLIFGGADADDDDLPPQRSAKSAGAKTAKRPARADDDVIDAEVEE